MLFGKMKTAVLLLVPLLLMSMAALAGQPPARGRVIGPASSAFARGLHPAPMALAAAGSPACDIYFDATGQLTFSPPTANTLLTPSIGVSNLFSSGATQGHGAKTATAIAIGTSLSANANINGVSLQAPNSQVSLNQIQGLAYFATDTSCQQSSFTTTLQSNPAGPAGMVAAQMGAYTINANYALSYADQGRYICNGGFFSYYCEVWRVDATFSFLTSSFDANDAGTYTLTINQVTMNSP